MLNEAWPYSLLLILLYNIEVDASQKRVVETELTEEEIIMTSLKFTNLLDKNQIHLITTSQQLMYLMLVYFGKDLNFLDPPVQHLISEKLKTMKRFTFPTRFNIKLNKEKSFESLYTMFLDTFQSNSYGDMLFSVIVMIPLAQKYDIKWRKLVWSEYVPTMKFVSCQEKDLLENFDEYLFPVETDLSLLKCYALALSSNLLRKGSVPWKIAEHHVTNARKASVSTP
jgi:RNA polymerase II-associated protein 1